MKYHVHTVKQIGSALRDIRKIRGLTQQEAARRAGVLPKTISGMENGATNYSVESLLRVLAAVGGSVQIAPAEKVESEFRQPAAEW